MDQGPNLQQNEAPKANLQQKFVWTESIINGIAQGPKL